MSEGDLEGEVLASQFRILKKLGAGGMGAVYLAEQIEMDRKVVVKVLHPELTAMNPTAIERFRREAKAVAQLNHPNIVQVFVFGQAENGQLYFAMEYIEGRDLAHDLAKGSMPQPRALKIIDQICAALIEAHGAGIVHRDLKPENVMLADRHGNPDYVKVLDFGIAKLHDSGSDGKPTLTQAGTVFGTPRYMSPEQVKGEPVDARSDIYAMGLLFHEMLTGRHPFVASSTIDYLMKHVSEPVPPPREAFADLDLSPRVESIIMKALEKDPADRYQSAAEMQRDVRTALRDFSEAVRGYPSAPPEPAPPTKAKTAASVKGRTVTHVPDERVPVAKGARKGVHPAVWAVVALILVGGLVGLVLALKPPAGGPAGTGGGTLALSGGDPGKPDPKKPDPKKPDPVKPDPVKPDPDKPDPDDGEKPDPDKPDPDKPDPDKPDPDEEPAPTTNIAENGEIDGFPLPVDTKLQASVSSSEIYDSTLPARDILNFYKAKLHGKYSMKPIPNGLMIEDEDSPFSYITITGGVGGHMMLALTRNTLVAPKTPTGPVEPAFGVKFPDDASSIMKADSAVVMRSKKPFKEVCDFYALSPEYGTHKSVFVSRGEMQGQTYCSIANTGQEGTEDLKWQAIAIVPDPMEAGSVMITVAPKMGN